ncbi:MAG TPA: ATP-dependent DNA ligase [Terriglobales bacterium]|jgi:ATP-dependent DNA ligase|nr:ATP-dependent DNA ligase [Terriglobales bacterium]
MATKRVKAGAVPAEDLKQAFAPINLPIQPPFPPAEAKAVAEIPQGNQWLYEPKWDGFRCLAFRSGKQVILQSKAGQPLGRYFPEMVEALANLPAGKFVLDGELVIFRGKHLSFDDLLMRIHPAESRIRKLSAETPATYLCFDLLVDEGGHSLVDKALSERREQLESFFVPFPKKAMVELSPASRKFADAEKWMNELGKVGLDGVIAKLVDEPYHSGDRKGMIKIKRIRSADLVVGGFRYAEKGGGIGSLLLGLYNDDKKLDHIGFTSSFTREQRQELKSVVEPLVGGTGFTGNAPGGPSRWSTERSSQWQALKPKRVCEVSYDHFSGGRFRHGTKFLRWRPEKNPQDCTFEQLQVPSPRKPK